MKRKLGAYIIICIVFFSLLANCAQADSVDSDGDGLSDEDEVNIYFTNPNLADSDQDSVSDGLEVLTYYTNPLKESTDGDYYDDGQELFGFSPYGLGELGGDMPSYVRSPGNNVFVAAYPKIGFTVSDQFEIFLNKVITFEERTVESQEHTYGTVTTESISTSVGEGESHTNSEHQDVSNKEKDIEFNATHLNTITEDTQYQSEKNIIGKKRTTIGEAGVKIDGDVLVAPGAPPAGRVSFRVHGSYTDKTETTEGQTTFKSQGHSEVIDEGGEQSSTHILEETVESGVGTEDTTSSSITTTITKSVSTYDLHTIGSAKEWANSTTQDTSDWGELRFDFDIENTGTDRTSGISDLRFFVKIGNYSKTYPKLSEGGIELASLEPGESHTYPAEIPLRFEEIKAIDTGTPIDISVLDYEFGDVEESYPEEAYAQSAWNGGVLFQIDDGIEDGEEDLEYYLVPHMYNATYLDVLKRLNENVPVGDPRNVKKEVDLVVKNYTIYSINDLPVTENSWWSIRTEGLSNLTRFTEKPSKPASKVLMIYYKDSDLDGYTDRSELKAETDFDNPNSYPAPIVAVGAYEEREGDTVTLKLKFSNVGRSDAYGMEARLYALDDTISIDDNFIGGAVRVKPEETFVLEDTFTYTINSEPYTEPAIHVLYNDPQGPHRFIAPVRIGSEEDNIDNFAHKNIGEPKVKIATPSEYDYEQNNKLYVVYSNPYKEIKNAKVYITYQYLDGTIIRAVEETLNLLPGNNSLTLEFNPAEYSVEPGEEIGILTIVTDYQGIMIGEDFEWVSILDEDQAELVLSENSWNFGIADQNSEVYKQFTILNPGLKELSLVVAGDGVEIEGLGAISENVSTSKVPPASHATFAVRVDTSKPGTFEGGVDVSSNTNNGEVLIPISGEVVDLSTYFTPPQALPRMDIESDLSMIPDCNVYGGQIILLKDTTYTMKCDLTLYGDTKLVLENSELYGSNYTIRLLDRSELYAYDDSTLELREVWTDTAGNFGLYDSMLNTPNLNASAGTIQIFDSKVALLGANGSDGGSCEDGTPGESVNLFLRANSELSFSGSIIELVGGQGGDGGSCDYEAGDGGQSGAALGTISANSGIIFYNSDVLISGGDGGNGGNSRKSKPGDGQNGANGYLAILPASTLKAVNSSLYVTGGIGGVGGTKTYYTGAGATGQSGSATLITTSELDILIYDSNITSKGGEGVGGVSDMFECSVGGKGGDNVLSVSSESTVTVYNSFIESAGGYGGTGGIDNGYGRGCAGGNGGLSSMLIYSAIELRVSNSVVSSEGGRGGTAGCGFDSCGAGGKGGFNSMSITSGTEVDIQNSVVESKSGDEGFRNGQSNPSSLNLSSSAKVTISESTVLVKSGTGASEDNASLEIRSDVIETTDSLINVISGNGGDIGSSVFLSLHADSDLRVEPWNVILQAGEGKTNGKRFMDIFVGSRRDILPSDLLDLNPLDFTLGDPKLNAVQYNWASVNNTTLELLYYIKPINSHGTHWLAIYTNLSDGQSHARYRFYVVSDNTTDYDSDGLTDYDECNIHRTNLGVTDTDFDDLQDNYEVEPDLKPIEAVNSDSDYDWIMDGSDPNVIRPADLGINRAWVSNPNPSEGEVITVYIEMENYGISEANDFLTSLYSEGNEKLLGSRAIITPLQSGDTSTLEIPLDTSGMAGIEALYTFVDNSNAVIESSEGNNYASISVDILGGDEPGEDSPAPAPEPENDTENETIESNETFNESQNDTDNFTDNNIAPPKDSPDGGGGGGGGSSGPKQNANAETKGQSEPIVIQNHTTVVYRDKESEEQETLPPTGLAVFELAKIGGLGALAMLLVILSGYAILKYRKKIM